MRNSIFIRSRLARLALGVSLGLAWPMVSEAQTPAATSSVTGQVNSPPRTFDVRNQDFSYWCQETQRYPRERCDARRRDDLDAFDSFRLTVERYEVEFMRKQERDRAAIERMNRDPTATERTLQDAPAR